jgi:hypothetical protein
MKETGILRKMKTDLQPDLSGNHNKAFYLLQIDRAPIQLNSFLDHELELRYLHEIHCIHCGKKTRKSWGQGYCYPCFSSLPETDVCILRPELCKAHLGISRDMAWAEQNCLQDHFVYLACSGGLKVGVTRYSQVPTRWIDQGAQQAILLARTPNRYLAGTIEVALKAHLSDKTNWRRMLTGLAVEQVDLRNVKQTVRDYLPADLLQYYDEDDRITEIHFPVIRSPEKVQSINFDKTDNVGGRLAGIKGQYLIFDGGIVFNIRRHSGYLTEIIIK